MPNEAAAPLIVLGVDPGLGITGYGAVRLDGRMPRVVEAGVMRSKAANQLPERLLTLHREFDALVREIQPSAVAVEDIYSRVKFPRTSIVMGHARGVLLLAAAAAGVDVFTYTATRVKQSVTGNGRAAKDQVARSVVNALSLSQVPQPADVTDALAIALCHANTIWHEVG